MRKGCKCIEFPSFAQKRGLRWLYALYSAQFARNLSLLHAGVRAEGYSAFRPMSVNAKRNIVRSAWKANSLRLSHGAPIQPALAFSASSIPHLTASVTSCSTFVGFSPPKPFADVPSL